jgi:hypothetical protein
VTTRPHKVHTQLGRAAVQIFAANDRINQILIEHLDPAAWRAKPPGKARTIAALFTHMHNVRCKWVRLTAPHLKVPRQLNRAHCTPRQARAGLAESAARCAEMLAEALGGVGAASRNFAETAGPGPGRLARKCCATCFLTKPTIAGRCVCLRISSDSRCRKRWRTGSGIGKSCGRSAGRLAFPATILKESLKGAGEWAARVASRLRWPARSSVERLRPSPAARGIALFPQGRKLQDRGRRARQPQAKETSRNW